MPQQLINRAMQLHRKQDLVGAISFYQQALDIDPSILQVWTNLGVALRKLKHYQSSLNCQLRALALAPENALVLNNLGNIYKDLNLLDESVRCGERACKLEPKNAGYWFNLAVNLREAQAYERALVALDKCIWLDPVATPKYEWEKALCYLYLGRNAEGWAAYRSRLVTGALPARQFACPEWQGEPLVGKKLWVVTEQGFGDTIFAARYLESLAAQSVEIVFECKPPLQRLLSNLSVTLVSPSPDQVVGQGCDYYANVMDLPGRFEHMGLPVPAPVSVTAPALEVQRFKQIIPVNPTGLNIGIVWSGSETFGDNSRRSPGLKPFLQLAAVPGVRLFSLQKGPGEKELDRHFARPFIVDLAPHIQDFADTAAAVSLMDLVVMSDSSVAHLTASLGKPVWNLLHSNPYWMYGLKGGSTQWYPAMRFIRQAKAGDWDSVFLSVVQEIEELLASSSVPGVAGRISQ